MNPASLLLAAGLTISGHTDPSDVQTLYRNSPIGPMRIHVATFDVAGEHAGYNQENCEMVARTLNDLPAVPDGYYWCEPGRFHE